MRSINTLEWHAGQSAVPLNAVSLKNTLLVKSFSYALQTVLYIPYQFNKLLDSLDTVPDKEQKKSMQEVHKGMQASRHQHIPSRVWQRHSALITMLEEERSAAASVEKETQLAALSQTQSVSEKTTSSSCSFNVLQVRCLPVWASNFSDIGMIEHELDFYSQVELVKEAV